MLVIDLNSPPTRLELEAELQQLKGRQKQLIRLSLISDGLHGSVFLALYLIDLLSGTAVLAAIGAASVVAAGLAMKYRQSLRGISWLVVAALTIGTMYGLGWLLQQVMLQTASGALSAALAAGSMVLAGAVLGRQLLQVMLGQENLKTFVEDELAQLELQRLCQHYPLLAAYRQQAVENLRPNLCYLELQAMRDWAAAQPCRG